MPLRRSCDCVSEIHGRGGIDSRDRTYKAARRKTAETESFCFTDMCKLHIYRGTVSQSVIADE